ncbi:hypothetical protein KTS45_13070 [Halomicroarcula limicola]|uniref:Small CPxCG-related zinc finger protein n=1 Tax=Haloarcula limicola TaxID=1429915 RepID=A0A8J7YC31_9EURY|nr:hypothetical protein [Halomicroarcula limicola]MBV0925129.1 hypothetical protein [Halomicroarcula limicola]
MARESFEKTTLPADSPRLCTTCGTPIDTTEWYPVTTVPEEGHRIYAFCGEVCRERWRRETDS